SMSSSVMRSFLVALFAFFLSPHAIADNCTLGQVASVDLMETRTGLFTFPATVGGETKPYMLSVDRAFSYVWTPVVDELHLERTPMPRGVQAYAFGESALNVVHPSLVLGNATVASVEFLELAQNPLGLPAIAGAIGTNALSHLDVELDLSRNK